MGLTLLYWRIGQHIHRELLGSERAAYGEQIVVTVCYGFHPVCFRGQ
jgi:hypothetical protein